MISCMERYSEQFLDICKKDFICTGYVCGVCVWGGRGTGDCKGWCVSLPGRGRLVARTWTCHPYCHRLSHVAELVIGLAVPSWLFFSFLLQVAPCSRPQRGRATWAQLPGCKHLTAYKDCQSREELLKPHRTGQNLSSTRERFTPHVPMIGK